MGIGIKFDVRGGTDFDNALMFCFPREEKDSDVFILAGQPAQSVNNILWYGRTSPEWAFRN
jgi:hypothetical protein